MADGDIAPIAKSGQPVQMSGGEARQHRTRACREQRDSKELLGR
jgi:hypothetical protein